MTDTTGVTKKNMKQDAPERFPDERIDQLLGQVPNRDAGSNPDESGLAGQGETGNHGDGTKILLRRFDRGNASGERRVCRCQRTRVFARGELRSPHDAGVGHNEKTQRAPPFKRLVVSTKIPRLLSGPGGKPVLRPKAGPAARLRRRSRQTGAGGSRSRAHRLRGTADFFSRCTASSTSESLSVSYSSVILPSRVFVT
ncbi:hypothetical protein R75461_05850 [Paraburkholderia nemoris]|nr:hypothetical protein R75461_05850 [Paraburkholderia nemoris]